MCVCVCNIIDVCLCVQVCVCLHTHTCVFTHARVCVHTTNREREREREREVERGIHLHAGDKETSNTTGLKKSRIHASEFRLCFRIEGLGFKVQAHTPP